MGVTAGGFSVLMVQSSSYRRSIERLYEFYHPVTTETTIGRTDVRNAGVGDTIEQVFESGRFPGYGQRHGERERDPRRPP
jgi:hypothetical protein